MRAAAADGGQLGLFFWCEVPGTGEQPAGDLPGLGHRRRPIGCGTVVAERGQVAADGSHAAGVAALVQSGVQGGGVGGALVPPLVKVGPERVQARFPDGLGGQIGGAGGVGEPPHGGAAQAQGPADRVQGLAGGERFVDGRMPFLGARHQAAPGAACAVRPARDAQPGSIRLLLVWLLLTGGGRAGGPGPAVPLQRLGQPDDVADAVMLVLYFGQLARPAAATPAAGAGRRGGQAG